MSSLSAKLVHGSSFCLAPGSIVMPIAPNSRRTPLPSVAPLACGAPAELTLVAGQLAVGHSVRPGGFRAEPFDLVLLVRTEVALEPEPLGLVVLVAFPRQDVRARAVEEPAVMRNHHRAAREVDQGVLQRAQRLDVQVVGRLVQEDEVAALLERQREVEPVA